LSDTAQPPADGTGQPFRSGYVAIIGPPNAGKSTLLNRLLSRHLSIVAPRPQTTRHRVLGILNGPGFQALFLDTPGLLDPKYALQKMMRSEIEGALSDSDVVVAVVDATSTRDKPEPVIAAARGRRALIAINKIDHVADKSALLPLVQRFAEHGLTDVFLVSALRGGGLEDLKAAIVRFLPEGQPFYPEDAISERNERFFTAEFIRECIFNLYGEEVPYATTVAIEEFKERPGRKDYVRAVVYVERDSQKAILIGKDGRALKRVGERARRRIESFLGRPVFLELWVKVAEDWRENERFIRENVYGRE
jgi:GTP-binding protein Era